MEIKRRRKKVKEGFNKLSFCFQRTNWCSLRECFETEKSRWETFRGEPDPIELWLVAGVVEEKEKKKRKKKEEHRAIRFFFPFLPVFLSLSSSNRRSTSVGICEKLSRYKLLKLSLVFVDGRDLWRLQHGISQHAREKLFFIGKFRCSSAGSNRLDAW